MIEEVESVFYECLIQLLFEKFEERQGDVFRRKDFIGNMDLQNILFNIGNT